MYGAGLEGGWDLFTFIFFGFIMYKACTKHWREIIISFLKIKNNLGNKIVGCLVALFLIITWFITLLDIIKIFK